MAGRREGFFAIFCQQFLHALLTEIENADHGSEIAIVVAWRPHIREHQLPNGINIFTRFLDLDWWHAQTLVEDFRCFASKTAWHHAAYLGDMADTDQIAEGLTLVKEGFEQGVFGHVQTAAIGVVVNQHVAFIKCIDWKFLGAGFY